jgi:hypothetical protein
VTVQRFLVRLLCVSILACIASPLAAQYQTPVVDGVVNPGEYAHSSGNWSLTWDATYLYIAKSALADPSHAVALYVDVDPRPTPTAGTAAQGNIEGPAEYGVTPDLPFRADARILGVTGAPTLRTADGLGDWSADNANNGDILEETAGNTREIRVRWSAIGGLPGVPPSFRWFGYELFADNTLDSMPDANGSSNAGGTRIFRYAYEVLSTTDGAATDPFSIREDTLKVAAASGAALSGAITLANDDTDSARRFLVFNTLPANTITTTTDLPAITQTTTIDGTTAPGYASTPVLVIEGFSTSGGADHGIRFASASNCVVRGLVLQNHETAIEIAGGAANAIAGNFIGTNLAGDAASANATGIVVNGCSGCTIGSADIADRNVVSGNLNEGISLQSTTGVTIEGNFIGTNAGGDALLTNDTGILLTNADETVIRGNVITTSESYAIRGTLSDDVSIPGNLMGVGADGTTALGGGNGVSFTASSRLTIGGIALAERNTIANFVQAIDADIDTGLLIRGNSLKSNGAAISLGNASAQPAPSPVAASLSDGNLAVMFSLASNSVSATTLSMQLDLYDADAASAAQGRTYRATSPCYSGSTLTDQMWAVPGVFANGDAIVLIATSYADANCTTPGDGSSANTTKITVSSAAATFIGPGMFSDTARWLSGALPNAGQDVVIRGSCTFDSAAPVRTYGNLTLGGGGNTGSLTYQPGNTRVLDVRDLKSVVTGGSLNLLNGFARIRGTFSVALMSTIDVSGSTIEFAGTNQTLPTLAYRNVLITGTYTAPAGPSFDGNLNVESGAAFSATSGVPTELKGGASVTGSGSVTFANVIVTGPVTIGANIAINTLLNLKSSITPAANAVIGGTGSLTSTGGTLAVTTTAVSGFASQYTLNTANLTNITVTYAGVSPQSITSRTYPALSLNNPAGATLDGDVVVSGLLTLNAGALGGQGFTIAVANPSPSAISATSGWVSTATLRRAFTTGTNIYFFPTGDDSGHPAPASVSINSASAPGEFALRASAVDEPALVPGSGLDPARDANIAWIATIVSGTLASYDVDLTFGSVLDAGASPTTFALRAFSSGSWIHVPSTSTATSISATALTPAAGSDVLFAMGNQLIDHYDVSAGASQQGGVAFLTTVTARDSLNLAVNDSSTVVTMSSDTTHALYDSDGNGTFDDSSKTLAGGSFSIATKDDVGEVVTLIASDGNGKSGASAAITVSGGAPPPPSGFSATANGTAQVVLTWSPASGAMSYQIFRNEAFLTSTPTAGYADNAVNANTTYVYKVRTVTGTGISAFTAPDAATTILFTDPVLAGVAATTAHITELRMAVDAMRAAAGLGAATFTDGTLLPQETPIKLVHVTELRTALDEARVTLGLPALSYTDPVISAGTTLLKASHLTELRDGTQ